jgi:hypothetical protein
MARRIRFWWEPPPEFDSWPDACLGSVAPLPSRLRTYHSSRREWCVLSPSSTPSRITANTTARIGITTTATITTDTAQMKRMTEFVSDVTRLADERQDPELRELVNELHADLMAAWSDDD